MTENKLLSDSIDFDTLVLSGGGIRGFNILGAVQACIDKNMLKSIKNYVGTSAGAIVCYLLAIGYTPIELVISLYTNKYLEKIPHPNIVSLISGLGATSFAFLQEALEKLTINKIGKFITLGKLKEEYGKNLVCVTYNMTLCITEYLSADNYPDLPCLTALRMSSNIPLFFDRFQYMQQYYLDGGISDNFPIVKGAEIGKKVLGIYINTSFKNLQDNPDDGMLAYFLKLLYVPIVQSTQNQIKIVQQQQQQPQQAGNNLQENSSICVIIPIQTEDMKNSIDFSIKIKERLDMFSIGYNSVNEYFSSTKSPSIPQGVSISTNNTPPVPKVE